VSDSPKAYLKQKLKAVSLQPGVYLMKDRLGSIIYVGKAKSLKKRLSEAEALLLETKLIKDYRPRYNILMRDDKRFLMVRVQLKDTYPKLTLTRLKKADGALYFGLNHEQDEPDSESKRAAYRLRIEEACELLSGKGKRSRLASIKAEMEQAAEKLQFERAAKLRNVYQNLEKVLNPTRQFKSGKGIIPTTVNPIEDLEELGRILNLTRPPKVMECFDISNVSSTHIVASMVRFIDGSPDNQSYRRYRIKSVDGQDDFASMAEVVNRRYRHIVEKNWKAVPEISESQEDLVTTLQRLGDLGKLPILLPDLIIVDGGKGQLSAATEQLKSLGLHNVVIVGLAKQREEIFFPNESEPVLIPHDKGALKLTTTSCYYDNA